MHTLGSSQKIFTISFNSLQTGKHICTLSVTLVGCFGSGFNSLQTGKHICTHKQAPMGKTKCLYVSIPFKRESIYARKPLFLFSFSLGFNSLQTGKHICTNDLYFDIYNLIDPVSIPFKRESIYALTLFSTPTTLDSGTPNSNANCAGLFFTQKLERKSPKPL